MLPLGFLIFPYLVYLIIKIPKEKTILYFFYGFCYGFGFLIIYLSWIHNPFLIQQSTKQYAIISIFLQIFLSIFFGLFFLSYKFLHKPSSLIILTPFIFISLEVFISNFIYGFPWVSFSLILSNNILGLIILKYFGSFASSYLIISLFLLTILFYYFNKSKILKIYFILSYLPFILIPIILNFDNNNPTKEINIEAHQILKPVNDYNKKNIKQNIINIINNSESEYIIFGENNFPYLINQLDYLDISKNIKKNQKLIIGASTIKDNNFYNSFILLEKNKVQYFDKKILVPFGEFLPFRRFLKFMESISGIVDFKKGSIERILITKDNLKILPVICYEIIFDKILNNIDNHRIDILINITNDSWFGNRVGPYQHFYITRAKSLIANRPLIRVSNNGISAIINKNGKVIISTKLNQITNFKYKLILSEQSSFIRFHNYYIFYFILITLIFIIISKKKINV